MISLELSQAVPAAIIFGTTLVSIRGAKIKSVVTEWLGPKGARHKKYQDPSTMTTYIEVPTGAKVHFVAEDDFHQHTDITIRDFVHGHEGRPFAMAQVKQEKPFVLGSHEDRLINTDLSRAEITATYQGAATAEKNKRLRKLSFWRSQKIR